MSKIRIFIIKLFPLFFLEWFAPFFSSGKDVIGNGIYYRLYDAKRPLSGAGILIRDQNPKNNLKIIKK